MKKICFVLFFIFLFLIIPVVHAESKYLYDVLKDEAESGGLAKEYTGAHHDSFVKEPSKKIYHWYASNNNDASTIHEKDNVLFANQCWKIIRTTDTGGVKLLYNGEAVDGKCETFSEIYGPRTQQYLSSSYYYGQSFTYNATTQKYSIAGFVTNNGVKVGQYTCKKYNIEDDCNDIYYVDEQSSGSYYYVKKVNVKFDMPSFNLYSNLYSVGYMYNTVYNTQNKPMSSINYEKIYVSKSSTINKTIWFGKSAIWGSPNADNYNLNDMNSVGANYSYSSHVGKYTFFNSSQTYTDSTVYYLAYYGPYDISSYSIPLSNGQTLSDVNYTYTYGDGYVDNGDGTFTIINPRTIYRTNYYNYYQAIQGKYVCKNAINNSCSDLWYAKETRIFDINYVRVTDLLYKYAKSFTRDGSKYILDDNNAIISWNVTYNGNRSKLNNAHYTCFNKTGECTTLSYVYYIMDEINMRYVDLTGGESIEDAVNKMLYNDDVNVKDSIIKTRVDDFYEKKLLNYSDYIEDTIFCNNRTQLNSDINGWNPNGGDVSTMMKFAEYNPTENLICTKETDSFSTLNNKAKLKYKIGLASSPEMNILGNSQIRNIGEYYWLGSPHSFDSTTPYMSSISYVGDFGKLYVAIWEFLRPAISLKSNIRYTSGDGSEANPYVVDLTKYYGINIEIKNETQDLNVEIDDLTQVKQEEEVTFKVTPIKGYQVNNLKILDEDNNEIEFEETSNKNEYTFIMPSSNVTIVPSYERVKSSVDVEKDSHTKVIVIEVNDSKAVVYEDTVKFRITPEDGYEVDTIEITDSEGNKIEYKKTKNENEYEFIMPDSDVSITPIYRKIENSNDMINPQTGNIKIIIFVIVLLGLIGCLYSRKKHINQE